MLEELLIQDPLAAESRGGPAEGWSPGSWGEADDPAAVGLVGESSGSVVSFDQKPPPPGQKGRRRELRFQTIENRLWLQWWEDEEYLGRSARLVNVSRHGAMIIAWVLLKEQQKLRLYLEEPAPQIGVDATVLGVLEGITGMHQIRLGFTSPCPDAFIEAAASGFEAWLDGKRPGF